MLLYFILDLHCTLIYDSHSETEGGGDAVIRWILKKKTTTTKKKKKKKKAGRRSSWSCCSPLLIGILRQLTLFSIRPLASYDVPSILLLRRIMIEVTSRTHPTARPAVNNYISARPLTVCSPLVEPLRCQVRTETRSLLVPGISNTTAWIPPIDDHLLRASPVISRFSSVS